MSGMFAGSEDQWLALALLYGPPPEHWASQLKMYGYGASRVIPLAFRIACEKVFSIFEVERVGLARMAYDYACWYVSQELDNANSR